MARGAHHADSGDPVARGCGAVLAAPSALRKPLLAALVGVIVLTAGLFVGPVASGAVLLLLPAPEPKAAHDLPGSYAPLHKGQVDLSLGLYFRENEDLVVRGTP